MRKTFGASLSTVLTVGVLGWGATMVGTNLANLGDRAYGLDTTVTLASLAGDRSSGFEGCGELVQGVECVLFQADSGGLFLLENLGGFGVGDRVLVTGLLDPGCFTICLQGDGCIFENTIEDCVEDDRITICHIPPGNHGNAHTITISINALPAHLAHGDTIGPCEGVRSMQRTGFWIAD